MTRYQKSYWFTTFGSKDLSFSYIFFPFFNLSFNVLVCAVFIFCNCLIIINFPWLLNECLLLFLKRFYGSMAFFMSVL